MSKGGCAVLGETMGQLLFHQQGRPGVEAGLPPWIANACGRLIHKGTNVPNLWLAGESDEAMQDLYQAISSQNNSVQRFPVVSLARLLYLYFKMLPTPLLSLDLHDYFIGASCADVFEEPQQRLHFVIKLIDMLPQPNRLCLVALLGVFAQVLAEGNLTNFSLTIDLWGSTLLCRPNLHDATIERKSANLILRFMVENYGPIRTFVETKASQSPANAAAAAAFSATQTLFKPLWLPLRIESSLKLIAHYLSILTATAEEFKRNCKYHQLELIEFNASLGLAEVKLKALVEKVDRDVYPEVLDSHHLERFCSYLLDFRANCAKDVRGLTFVQNFTSRRLRGGVEKLAVAMQYELLLFISTIDKKLQKAITSSNTYVWNATKFTTELIADQSGATFWKEKFGPDAFIVPVDRVIRELNLAIRDGTEGIDPALAADLSRVFDDSRTGFVTAYKFGAFLRGFGPFPQVKSNARNILSAPWFHGYLSEQEAPRILQPLPEGSFLVRFVGNYPDAFAIHCKTKTGQESYQLGIDRKTTLGMERKIPVKFIFIPQAIPITQFLIDHKDTMKFAPTEKLAFKDWFYGDISKANVESNLEAESVGTFMIRFSADPASSASLLTASWVGEGGALRHIRIARLSSGQVECDSKVYSNLQAFVDEHPHMFKKPFKNENLVSATEAGDDIKRVHTTPVQLMKQPEESRKRNLKPTHRGLLTKQSTFVPDPRSLVISSGSSIAPDSPLQGSHTDERAHLLADLLTKVKLTPEEDKDLAKLLFQLPQEVVYSVQRRTQELRTKQALSHSGILEFLSPEKSHSLVLKNLIQNTEVTLNIHIENKMKTSVDFITAGVPEVTSQYFIGVTPRSKILQPRESSTIQVTVVLFKPIDLHKVLRFKLSSGQYSQTIRLPLRASVSKASLLGMESIPRFWSPKALDDPKTIVDLEAVLGEAIGKGNSGSVHRIDIYGVTVAVKYSTIGNKDQPKADFKVELDMFCSLRQENLVAFIGAISRVGRSLIVLEWMDAGLDKFLRIFDYVNADQRDECPVPVRDRLDLAIDAARGLLYLHDMNVVHRDVKSLNFLVKKSPLRVKISDFGESYLREHAIGKDGGTMYWQAPEARVLNIHTTKSDVFSFGLVLYELLSLCYPSLRTPTMVDEGTIHSPPDLIAAAHPEWTALINACCRTNPDKRPTMFGVLTQLQALKTLPKYQPPSPPCQK